MTLIQISRSGRARLLAGVALSALFALAPAGATPTFGQTTEQPAQKQEALSLVLNEVAQSVVTVTTTKTGAPGSDLDPNQDVLREFFRRFGNGDEPTPDLPFAQPEPATDPARVAGSGFALEPEEGLIVTAEVLVADADVVEVTLADGESHSAEIVGRDAQTGIALLRVEDQGLPGLSWGSAGELGLGESLLSVGRTGDFGAILSTGLLAGRSSDGERLLIDDTPGWALVGAPVLDGEGRVVAIRTGAEDSTATGAAVALSADVARDVADELAQSGVVARAYLGIQIQPITADVAAALGLDGTEGVLVAGVQPDTPAATAGLQDGDVILSMDGETVSGPEALSAAVASREPGEQVRLEVWRSDEVVEVTANLEAQPGTTAVSETEAPAPGVSVPELGLTLQPLTPDLHDALGMAATTKGVAVLEVEDPSRTNVQQGDVIVSVHRTAVETVEDVQEAVEAAQAEGRSSVLLLIDRGGERTFVAVPLTQS